MSLITTGTPFKIPLEEGFLCGIAFPDGTLRWLENTRSTRFLGTHTVAGFITQLTETKGEIPVDVYLFGIFNIIEAVHQIPNWQRVAREMEQFLPEET